MNLTPSLKTRTPNQLQTPNLSAPIMYTSENMPKEMGLYTWWAYSRFCSCKSHSGAEANRDLVQYPSPSDKDSEDNYNNF